MKKLTLMTLLCIFFLGMTAYAFAGGGNAEGETGFLPEDAHGKGPAIRGELTIAYNDGTGIYDLALVGFCKKNPVMIQEEYSADALGITVDTTLCGATRELLTSMVFLFMGPEGCYSEGGGEHIFAINAHNIVGNCGNESLTADVIVLQAISSDY